MITFIRKLFESKLGAILAIIFVAIIGLAFALSDVSGSFSSAGVGGGTVAKVGSTEVTESDLSDAVDRAFRQAQQDDATLTMATFVQKGGVDQILEQLINSAAIAEYGASHGIAVSKAMVDAEIRDIPAFKGLDGSFDTAAFRDALSRNRVSEDQFREDVRRGLFLEQLLSATGYGVSAADNLALPYASLILEERKGGLAFVPSEAFTPKADPGAPVLAAFYDQNKASFVVPERRSIRYALFGREAVANKIAVTDADVAKYYRDNASDYAASEERTLTQLIVPTQSAAQAVAKRAAAGESLSAIASDIGVAVSTANGVTQSGYASQTSDAVAKAAFSANQGVVAAPARGALGWYVTRVDSQRSVAGQPLSAVAAAIRNTLLTERTQSSLDQLTGDIEERLSNGATIAEIAKSVGSEVQTTPAVFQDGRAAQGGFKLPETLIPVAAAAFQMERDGDPQLLQVGQEQQFAVVGLAGTENAAPPPLASIRPQLIAAWKRSEALKLARAVAVKVRDSVNKNTSLQQALASSDAPRKQVQPIAGTRQQLTQAQGPVPLPLQLLFSMTQGSTKLLEAPEQQGWFIINLRQLVPNSAAGNKPLLEATKQQLAQALGQEFAGGFVQAMRAEIGVKMNGAVVDRIRQRLAGTGS